MTGTYCTSDLCPHLQVSYQRRIASNRTGLASACARPPRCAHFIYVDIHSLASCPHIRTSGTRPRNPVFSCMLLKDTETPKDWRNPCHFHCHSPSHCYSVRTLHHLLFHRLRRFDPPFRVLLSRLHPSYRRHRC